jgi:hypothetical protein
MIRDTTPINLPLYFGVRVKMAALAAPASQSSL